MSAYSNNNMRVDVTIGVGSLPIFAGFSPEGAMHGTGKNNDEIKVGQASAGNGHRQTPSFLTHLSQLAAAGSVTEPHAPQLRYLQKKLASG